MEQAQDEKTDMLMTTSVDCQVEQGGWQDQLVAQLSKEGGSLLSLINGCSNVNVALVSLGTPFVSLCSCFLCCAIPRGLASREQRDANPRGMAQPKKTGKTVERVNCH